MIKLLKKRERNILYLAIGVILFSLVFNFIVSPLMAKYANFSREVSLTRAKLMKYKVLLGQKNLIEKKYAGSFSPASDIPGLKQDSLVASLYELEKIAQNAGIRIIDLRPGQAVKTAGEPYKEVLIDMRAEGSMDSYVKFLYAIGNSLWILKVKEFQLSAKNNSAYLAGDLTISQVILSN